MRFPYKRLVVQSQPGARINFISRPVIPIHIRFRGHPVAYEALVDSGADYSIFHTPYGILGQAELFKQFVVTFDREAGWLDLRLRRD